MKRIHGVFSIKPATLKDVTVADDAAIQEHKLLLDYNTSTLNTDIADLRADFTAHTADNSDPHGATLYQTTLRAVNLECTPTAGRGAITVRNTGAGTFTLNVIGSVNATLDTHTTTLHVDGMSTLGNTTINGDLLVNGSTITVNSAVTDYDQLTVTPTTLTNPIGVLIRPDDEGQTAGTYSYIGDLVYAEKRVSGVNSLAFRIDYLGNVQSTGTTITLGNNTWTNNSTKVTASLPQDAPQYAAHSEEGFKFVATVNTPTTDKTFVAYKANGTSPTFYANKNGDLWAENRLGLGNSAFLYWDGVTGRIIAPENFQFEGTDQYFNNSPIHLQATSKTEWIVKNNNSAAAFYYGTQVTPLVEFTAIAAYLNQATTYVQNLNVGGSLVMTPSALIDGVDVGSHNHAGTAGMGVRLPATSVIDLQEHFDGHTRRVWDTVGGMVSSNTESGIAVTYDYTPGKLNFDVNDFTITLGGDCTGNATITNLASATLTVAVVDNSHDHTNLTGTTSTSFWLDSDGSGPLLKNISGGLVLRNGVDNAYTDLTCHNLTVQGTTTTVHSETMTIDDNTIVLNSNVTAGPTENAGIEVERGTSTNASCLWDEGIDRWTCGVNGVLSPVVTEATLTTPTSPITEGVQDIVGGMINTTNGISVTYDDPNGKLNFDVNDFTITLAGNCSGSVGITNLVSATLSVTVLDSDKCDGLHVHTGRNSDANKIVRTDASGYTQLGWINTISGDNGTTAMDRVYASNDGYIRYYTPAHFADQILALGSAQNAHTHTGAAITTSVAAAANDLVVSQMLRWKNYGSSHVIFDASNSTSPTGSAVNNTTAAIAWAATYPNLMGWNGTSTYGVRVDACRLADTATTAAALGGTDSSWFVQKTSLAARPGVTKLYRKDSDSNYNVQTNWTGVYWRLDGYNVDTAHAGCSVAYADSAGNAGTVNGLQARSGSGTFSAATTISFTAMPHSTYSVSITPTGAPTGHVGEIGVYSKTTSSFIVGRTGASTGTFDWILLGS